MRVVMVPPTAAPNPVTMYDAGTIATVQQVCEYLAWVENDLSLRPVLAQSWSSDPAGKVWTFKLRAGVTFNNGKAFGADDVVATFKTLTNPKSGSAALSNFAGILGPAGIEKVDAQTVRFNLDRAFVDFPYLVASTNYNAVILPASNWFARRFGRKRFLLTCVILFTIASFFCGAAPSLGVILLARVLQGAGGGALQPLSQSILLESFPVSKRSMSMAAYGLGIVLAPVIGPTLGGWLTDTFSWRYAFYINIPVGILAVILISRFVHDPPYIKNAKVGPFDNIGFGLLMVWTGSLQIVLDKGQEDDWFGATWVDGCSNTGAIGDCGSGFGECGSGDGDVLGEHYL